MRILLIGEGNFSYTFVLLKDLQASCEDITVVATDYQQHDLASLASKAAKLRIPKNINLVFYDNFDATKADTRINAPFDRIICNFPTPLGKEKFDLEQFFHNVIAQNWLTKAGSLEIAYWVDEYAGTYEYAYRLARAQKKHGYKLISREILDFCALREKGYVHTTFSGAEDQIKRFPLLAKYKKNLSHYKTLTEAEYDELSDSEELAHDAMPPRGWTHFCSSHKIQHLNIHGKKMPRWKYKLSIFNTNKDEYTLENVLSYLEQKEYRKAEKILNLFVFEASKDNKYRHKLFNWGDIPANIINKIHRDYELLPTSKKPCDTDLINYYNFVWYSKLKVLTGVEIPTLMKSYRWN